jgi:hypothetical protein
VDLEVVPIESLGFVPAGVVNDEQSAFGIHRGTLGRLPRGLQRRRGRGPRIRRQTMTPGWDPLARAGVDLRKPFVLLHSGVPARGEAPANCSQAHGGSALWCCNRLRARAAR